MHVSRRLRHAGIYVWFMSMYMRKQTPHSYPRVCKTSSDGAKPIWFKIGYMFYEFRDSGIGLYRFSPVLE